MKVKRDIVLYVVSLILVGFAFIYAQNVVGPTVGGNPNGQYHPISEIWIPSGSIINWGGVSFMNITNLTVLQYVKASGFCIGNSCITSWEDIGYGGPIAMYLYRVPIKIIEKSGSNLEDYTVNLKIDTASLISAGKMNPDCSDIRFTDVYGTKLFYWIESGCNTQDTSIWIRVPFIPGNGNVTIYMYYGNPNAIS